MSMYSSDNPYAAAEQQSQHHAYADSSSGGQWQCMSYDTALLTPPTPKAPAGITTLAYDPLRELVWCGTSTGYVSSIYHGNLQKRSIFSVDPAVHYSSAAKQQKRRASPVIAILPHVQGLSVVTQSSIRFHSRGGLCHSTFTDELLTGSPAEQQNHLNRGIDAVVQPDFTLPELWLAARNSTLLLKYDLVAQSLSSPVKLAEGSKYSVMRATTHHRLVAGTRDGHVEVRDTRANCRYAVQQFSAHPSLVTDLDVTNDTVITCGLAAPASDRWSAEHGNTKVDPLIKAFDLRKTGSIMQPIPFRTGGGACRLKFLPKFTQTFVATSRSGHWQQVDVLDVTGATSQYHQLQGMLSNITALDVSSTGESILFGDASCVLQEWWNTPTATVNTYSQQTDVIMPTYNASPLSFALPITSPASWIHEYPTQRMVANKLLPLSATWAKPFASVTEHADLSQSKYPAFDAPRPPTPPIDSSLLPDVKTQDIVGYTKNPDPARLRPNSEVTIRKFSVASRSGVSDKLTAATQKASDKNRRSFAGTLNGSSQRQDDIPAEYARVTIQIPKLGLYAFDFSSYNDSPFTGLDNLLPHSYSNAAIQMFYFINDLRTVMLQHMCDVDNCLSCELGSLFHMLDLANGNTAEPRNFLRALQQIPEADALGLLDPITPTPQLMLAVKIQDFIRFLLQHLDKEEQRNLKSTLLSPSATTAPDDNTQQQQPSIISQLFGYLQDNEFLCLSGRHSQTRSSSSFFTKLAYPATRKLLSFSDILTASMCEQTVRRTLCSTCNSYELTRHTKFPSTLPRILNIAPNVNTDSELDLWRSTKQQLDAALKLQQRTPVSKRQSSDKLDASVSDEDANWLPLYMLVELTAGTDKVTVERLTEERAHELLNDPRFVDNADRIAVYELTSVLAHVADATDDSALYSITGEHLTAHIKVKHAEVYGSNYNTSSNHTSTVDDMMAHNFAKSVTHHSQASSDSSDSDNDTPPVATPEIVRRNSTKRDSFANRQASDKSTHIPADRWWLFNDFVIQPSTANEATNFTYSWKQPAEVFYTKMNVPAVSDDDNGVVVKLDSHEPASKSVFTDMIFDESPSLSTATDHDNLSFTPLKSDAEPMSAGTLVAIDCEYVSVEAAVEKEDAGEVRPARLSLARVSVIRAEGEQSGTPFMDDYIVATEPVVDYLTKYSGLREGDLGRNTSKHYLQPMKRVYCKLRSLVDRGCKFIGHGLKKDFQMVNIYVPPEQIIDTVELYWLPAYRRRLGLKFLAHYVLKQEVQVDTHDSIEDARTAWLLYLQYRKWSDAGGKLYVEEQLQQLYQIGRANGFKL